MCGICAIAYSTCGDAKKLLENVKAMSTLLRHRGPDWSGAYVSRAGDCALAHERLAIVDPASGKQPLFSPTSALCVSVNGEIYNHQALTKSVLPPCDASRLPSKSDCAVIPLLLEIYGPLRTAELLDGQFAFVALNEERGEIIAARDHMGICPLYIGWAADGSVHFASEMKALQHRCVTFREFPPGHVYYERRSAMPPARRSALRPATLGGSAKSPTALGLGPPPMALLAAELASLVAADLTEPFSTGELSSPVSALPKRKFRFEPVNPPPTFNFFNEESFPTPQALNARTAEEYLSAVLSRSPRSLSNGPECPDPLHSKDRPPVGGNGHRKLLSAEAQMRLLRRLRREKDPKAQAEKEALVNWLLSGRVQRHLTPDMEAAKKGGPSNSGDDAAAGSRRDDSGGVTDFSSIGDVADANADGDVDDGVDDRDDNGFDVGRTCESRLQVSVYDRAQLNGTGSNVPKSGFARWYAPSWLCDAVPTVPVLFDSLFPVSDAKTAEQRIRNLLTRAVQKRLMSDVPFGVLLSGGLDSSIIASILCREMRAGGILSQGSRVGTDETRDERLRSCLPPFPKNGQKGNIEGRGNCADSEEDGSLGGEGEDGATATEGEGADSGSGEAVSGEGTPGAPCRGGAGSGGTPRCCSPSLAPPLVGEKIHSFSIGIAGSPDLAAARLTAEALGTHHTEFKFTVEEGLAALPEVIYHLETYDVTTIRAAVPMFLLSKYIRSFGAKFVFSGEGADEIFGGYLYFHKAPDKYEFFRETQRKLRDLHMYDVLRANKASMAAGLEVRVPFLDRDFLDFSAGSIDPALKMCRARTPGGPKVEKYLLRSAFRGYLPDSILWRQKEQFSDGVGYGWIDALKEFAETQVTSHQMELRKIIFPYNSPTTKEAYFYRTIFHQHFPAKSAERCVPGGPSIACSSAAAVDWDPAFRMNADQSGRSVQGVHNAPAESPLVR